MKTVIKFCLILIEIAHFPSSDGVYHIPVCTNFQSIPYISEKVIGGGGGGGHNCVYRRTDRVIQIYPPKLCSWGYKKHSVHEYIYCSAFLNIIQ